MKKWFVFYHGDHELCAITAAEVFLGEIDATVEMLAGENGISKSSVRVALENR